MNAPHSLDHIVLNDDEVKVRYIPDTKLADAGTFEIAKEDHTLGNLLRMGLLRDGRVLFGGYRMPHPLENRLLIKVKTRPITTPKQAMLDNISNLQQELKSLEEQFKRQITERSQKSATSTYM